MVPNGILQTHALSRQQQCIRTGRQVVGVFQCMRDLALQDTCGSQSIGLMVYRFPSGICSCLCPFEFGLYVLKRDISNLSEDFAQLRIPAHFDQRVQLSLPLHVLLLLFKTGIVKRSCRPKDILFIRRVESASTDLMSSPFWPASFREYPLSWQLSRSQSQANHCFLLTGSGRS